MSAELLARARRDYEDAMRDLRASERTYDEADTAAASARRRYEDLLGVNAQGQPIRAGTPEADQVAQRLDADRKRARELFESAGKPVPEWLR